MAHVSLNSANSPVRCLSVPALLRRARRLLNPYAGSPYRQQTVRRMDGLIALRGRASHLLSPYARHPYRQYEWPEEGLFSIDKIYSPDLANKYQAACNVMPTTGPHRSTKRPSGAAGVTTLRGLRLHGTNECDVIRKPHASETYCGDRLTEALPKLVLCADTLRMDKRDILVCPTFRWCVGAVCKV